MSGAATEVLAFEHHLADLLRMRVHPGRAVGDDRVGLPRVPQPAAEVDVFGDAFVADRPVRHLLAVRGELRRRVRADDVPGDPPAREMVERREPPRHRVRVLERRRQRDADTQTRRRPGDDGRQRRGFVRRGLYRVADGRVTAVLERVVRGELVGQEDRVEEPALQRARQVLPVGR
jgi:hypothetical protein